MRVFYLGRYWQVGVSFRRHPNRGGDSEDVWQAARADVRCVRWKQELEPVAVANVHGQRLRERDDAR